MVCGRHRQIRTATSLNVNDRASIPGKGQDPAEDRETRSILPDAAGIAEAATLLRAGGLVAFPTETVYGLGADASDGEAVAGIYSAKGRPSFNPLIAHVVDLAAAEVEGVFGPEARALAEAFWPGPLTLVVPAAPGCSVSDLARAGLDSVALRVPAHPVAQALLRATGRPVAAPSANRSGRVSPTTADHVREDLGGRIDAIVEGGSTPVGVESTIVSCLGGRASMLRPGGIPREAIERILGHPLVEPEAVEDRPVAPGMLRSHYAPEAAVRLDAHEVREGEAVLLFGGFVPAGLERAKARLDLSAKGDLAEAAAHLFSHLRRLDAVGAATIAVTPIPGHGLGEAILDRLRRAAAPRS
jgi:L-threonylcarbamoyladenylate synthase